MAENKVRFLRGTAAEYAGAVKDDDTFYYTTDDEKFYVGSKEITGGGITVDSKLSDTSTNPVQNKVIKAAIDDKADKTIATTDTDGLMSAADKTKLDNADDTYALKSKYGDTTIDVGRKSGTTVGEYSTAEGSGTTASGNFSHTEGSGTTASGNFSHTEGSGTTASGNGSHSEGGNSIASGSFSHAEGADTTASNYSSHAGGSVSEASGRYSFSHGNRTQALHESEVAFGQNNISNDNTLFSIGDGAYNARHNAFEITTTGGKLHDKDIAVIDDIPSELPANGGNADYAANAGNAEKLGGLDASAYSTSIIKSTSFAASTTDGYIWTGIPFPKYIVGVDLGHFDVIAQFCKGNHAEAGRAEWLMMPFSKDDLTTPLKGSFSGVIYYIG